MMIKDILAGFCCLIFLVLCVGTVGGGYWENMSFFNRISGPQRLRQYVIDPLPRSFFDIRGGYSGFPQGRITTCFRFADESIFSQLHDWEAFDNYDQYHPLVQYREFIGATVVLRKIGSKKVFLLINPYAKKAMLLVL